MQIVDRGNGPALVLVPGIQGRWEYVRPAVDALSACFRVITFALCDEDQALDEARGLDQYTEQVTAALDEKGLASATICGISFGGLAAIRFAAKHPAAVDALVIASTPGPTWRVRPHHAIYARMPWLFGPLFLVESPWRMHAEFAAAFPDRRARRAFKRAALRTVLTSPISLRRMAARTRLLSDDDLRTDCARITAPTLVVTGEAHLDHVVPVESSLEYARLIPGARAIVLERTGHLGTITRPRVFADAVKQFVEGARHAAA
ncbi:MAG: alpha/beta hydrolase [Acidobacteria bacterium]|nr:alpha/beta hydrolase [Acidobacteriota bacterium]